MSPSEAPSTCHWIHRHLLFLKVPWQFSLSTCDLKMQKFNSPKHSVFCILRHSRKYQLILLLTDIILHSWHEMGVYDLPAVIDYTLNYTAQKSLYYVGHSMGSTMFYVLMSVKPEYNTKIRHMVALAPAAFLRNTKSLITLAKFFPKGVSSEILKRNSYSATKGP